jgi:hypothetical protein
LAEAWTNPLITAVAVNNKNNWGWKFQL